MSFFSMQGQQGPVWMDGKLVPWNEATLHVLSHGLNNATCVFEGERVYSGRVFKLEEHTARLFRSARVLGIEIPHSHDRLVEATRAVIAAQSLRSGYVRPVVWRGPEDLGIDAPHAVTHCAIAALSCEDVVPPELRRRGVKLGTSRWLRPDPRTAPIDAKASCHYVVGNIAIREAKANGYDEALLLDYRGYVAEATGANFFMVRDGALHTPIADCALNGITRQTVIELARARGLEVIEKHFPPEEMRMADEAFLTGTACEVLPVRQIDVRQLPDQRPITEALLGDYFQLVGKE